MTDVEETEPATPWPLRRRDDRSLDRSSLSNELKRVVVIDDHALLADSVVMTLRQSGLDARSMSWDLPDLGHVVLRGQPNLVLLDLFLDDGVATSNALLSTFVEHGILVVVVTATHDPLLHARCLEIGACGVVEKSQPIDELIDAVHRALRGEAVMSVSRVAELQQALGASRRVAVSRSPLDDLTAREKLVLQSMMRGEAAARIARDHQLSVLTVRTHIRSVLTKLDVHSQLEAVSRASREGWFNGV